MAHDYSSSSRPHIIGDTAFIIYNIMTLLMTRCMYIIILYSRIGTEHIAAALRIGIERIGASTEHHARVYRILNTVRPLKKCVYYNNNITQ